MKLTRAIAVLTGAALLALVLGVSFAAIVNSGPTHSTITTGTDGLRTFTVARVGDQPILCTLGRSIPELSGALGGEAGAADPVWLEATDGHRMAVVWPAGFAVRFNPEVELLDDRGRSVATAGETVTLGQVSSGSAAGTHDDPYIASGLVFGGCYIYNP